MSFKDFHRWLKKECEEPRETETLGYRTSFKATISNDGSSLTIEFGNQGGSGSLSRNELFLIWERYWDLGGRKHMTSEYNEPEWSERPHRILAPYVPALIRDFENDFTFRDVSHDAIVNYQEQSELIPTVKDILECVSSLQEVTNNVTWLFVTKEQKKDFLNRVKVASIRDALRNSLVAAFQHNPIYKPEIQQFDRKPLRKAFRNKLQQIGSLYSQPVTEESHIDNIVDMADSLSSRFGYLLKNNRFRIGTSQKAINLFVKFLWCLNDNCPTPPHCPIDRKILDEVSIDGSWTKLDSIIAYQDWIQKIREHVRLKNYESIAEWELDVWNR